MTNPIRVTIWNEGWHEKNEERIRAVYPQGIHAAIAEGLDDPRIEVQTATFFDPDLGLTDEVLASTDVLFWWGHVVHRDVPDELVNRIQARVLDGMGLVVLHSGHHSKIFQRLMGTSCNLSWREHEGGERERVWCLDPAHPVAEGCPEFIEIPRSEMYGEPFDIPQPDRLVFVSWVEGGEVFRSGCCYHRGRGRIFYFSPGHEAFPIYYQPEIRRVLTNAALWCAPLHESGVRLVNRHRPEPLSPIAAGPGA
ncbi:trehalose utilization protein ThuA [Rubellimicrobium rubrum]|uniref:Trehalose utilization protein ThuA n=1 Tax=Rubellimicrobium rubrum TaxID=2585369 RepID=A0A5C4MZG3_9RHOB|nr:ThuA domain-containing protein [Rubellimicrobium rubrum]TNC51663.1 trehalose utilization protein ThuA [Rubellimicrobium rubrum]